MREIYEQMRAHIRRQEQSRASIGPSTRDVVSHNCSERELQQLVEALREIPPSGDVTFRLWSFICEAQQERIPEHLRRQAADNLAPYLASAPSSVDNEALQLFIIWGKHRSDHRVICEPFLRHPSGHIRMTAVQYAGWYSSRGGVDLLIEFQRDPLVAETGGMGGPLRYILRDKALEILETLTKSPVTIASDCWDETPNGRVWYRTWVPFLKWYENNKTRFR